jgi:hypothetical protein
LSDPARCRLFGAGERNRQSCHCSDELASLHYLSRLRLPPFRTRRHDSAPNFLHVDFEACGDVLLPERRHQASL